MSALSDLKRKPQPGVLSDKAQIVSILNSLTNDPFYTHLVSLFAKEFSIQMLHKLRNLRQ